MKVEWIIAICAFVLLLVFGIVWMVIDNKEEK